MAKAQYRCARCDRTFSMPAHLARHTSAMHKRGRKKAAAKRRRKARARRAVAGRRGRGAASRLGLRNMTLEQLTQVVAAARAEARRKIADFERAMK